MVSEAMDDSLSSVLQTEPKKAESEKVPQIAKEENKAVGKLRLLVLGALLLTGVLLSLVVFVVGRDNEQNAFRSHFESHALKAVDSFNDQVRRQLGVMDSFSKSITSFAIENNLMFPNVTLPNFEMRGISIRQQIGALRVDWFPFVEDANREQWEAYAYENKDWLMASAEREYAFRLDQDARFQYENPGGIPGVNADPLQVNETIVEDESGEVPGPSSNTYHRRIYGQPNGGGRFEVETNGPYFLLWQFSPVTPTIGSLNLNMLTVEAQASFRHVMKTERAILGNALALTDPDDPSSGSYAKVYAKSLTIGQYRHSLDLLAGDPSTVLVYPVFSNFRADRELVGAVRAGVYWRFYFVNIMPVHVQGMICVIANSWNQTFTYRIDGPEVTFLGPGDRHDPDYEDYFVEYDVTDALQADQGPVVTAFRQAEYDGNFCSYTLRLYPSQAMEEGIITVKPLIFALLVMISFIVPSFTFLVYNRYVERRQTVVMDQAVATGNIVSSLFPDNVAQRLLKDGRANNTSFRTKDSLMARFQGIDSGSGQILQASEPIADKFESCTVMFGDLAGFTKWSSTRTPDEVFILLESIYCAFDSLAEQRGVFKVETVGKLFRRHSSYLTIRLPTDWGLLRRSHWTPDATRGPCCDHGKVCS